MMIDEEFLSFLEYEISRALPKSISKEYRSYWCDGIVKPDNFDKIGVDQINKEKIVVLAAYMPKGQYENPEYKFSLNLRFGPEALNLLQKSKRLEPAVFPSDSDHWIRLMPLENLIVVQLK